MRVAFTPWAARVNQNRPAHWHSCLRKTATPSSPTRKGPMSISSTAAPSRISVIRKAVSGCARAKREEPGAVTVLTGCYPQAFPRRPPRSPKADVVTGSGNRHAILADVQKVLNGEEGARGGYPSHEEGRTVLKNCPWISLPSTPAPLSKVEGWRQPPLCPTASFPAPAASCAAETKTSVLEELRRLSDQAIKRSC